MQHTDSSTTRPVLVVGSVAFDAIKTPFESNDRILGGSATYGAIASSFFAPTRLVGVVGSDFAESDIGRLKAREIDLEGLQIDGSGETFFWSGVYGENFATRQTLETRLNVFADFKPTLPPSYRTSPFALLGNIQPSLQAMVLDQLEAGAFTVADTMNLWIDLARPELLALLPRVSLFILNDEEAQQLTGEANVFLAGPKLRQLGPRIVLIKKGAHGSVLFHPEGLFALPAYPVERVADPTGAGDSYAGALVGALAAAGDVSIASMRRAVAYATVTASLTVESLGVDRLAEAGRAEIDRRCAELHRLTAFEL
ncbi:PfkB family carbohydrate kinase [Opitutales bacterium ASA1]|uniref:PfkB family carbohydrate kinase n=1 Tax=Congregicoccus parvus TaxID=3081749 RepID=UPI002B2F0E87|nr:PfkB family carbohydrate kinase [Opitutales bacterium ASA1]